MDVVSWHEGDETEYFTRIIYLYVDERIKGFVAESGELGWRVFKFSVPVDPPQLSLPEAKALLMQLIAEEEN